MRLERTYGINFVTKRLLYEHAYKYSNVNIHGLVLFYNFYPYEGNDSERI